MDFESTILNERATDNRVCEVVLRRKYRGTGTKPHSNYEFLVRVDKFMRPIEWRTFKGCFEESQIQLLFNEDDQPKVRTYQKELITYVLNRLKVEVGLLDEMPSE